MDLRELWKRSIRAILNAAAEGEPGHRTTGCGVQGRQAV